MIDSNTDISPKRFSPGAICLFLILLLSLIARFGLMSAKPDFSYTDEYIYLDVARNIAEDNQYRLTKEGGVNSYAIRQAPGLPLILGITGKAIPLNVRTAKVVNNLMGWMTVAVYAWALWIATGHIWITAAGSAFIGFHPTFLYLGNTNYPQTGQALFLAILIAVICFQKYRARKENSPYLIVTEGVVTGVGALFVPTQCFILPAIVLAHWKSGLKKMILYAVILAAAFLAVLTPWIIRNAVKEKAFIPFSTNGGEQMFLGFNDQAGMNTGIMINRSSDLHARLMAAASGKERENILKNEAIKWIRADYSRAIRLWTAKAFNYFRWDVGKMVTQEEKGGAMRLWATRLTSLFVFTLGLAGILYLRKDDIYWCILVTVFMFCLAVGHAFFISRYRYRIPIELMLMFVGFVGLAKKIQSKGLNDESHNREN